MRTQKGLLNNLTNITLQFFLCFHRFLSKHAKSVIMESLRHSIIAKIIKFLTTPILRLESVLRVLHAHSHFPVIVLAE